MARGRAARRLRRDPAGHAAKPYAGKEDTKPYAGDMFKGDKAKWEQTLAQRGQIPERIRARDLDAKQIDRTRRRSMLKLEHA